MQLSFPNFGRAPSRGRYERRYSSTERFLVQRARLLRATAIAELEGASSVTRVTALSGVGRTTFYECFDDFEHARKAVIADVGRRVGRALMAAKASDVTQLCAVWLECLAADPVTFLVALQSPDSELLAQLRRALQPLFPATQGNARWMHALACAEASARATALSVLGAVTKADGFPDSIAQQSPEVECSPEVENKEVIVPGAAVADATAPLAWSIHCLLAQSP